MCFHVKFAKFFGTPFFYKTPLMAVFVWICRSVLFFLISKNFAIFITQQQKVEILR